MYWPKRSRIGRDSIFVRLICRRANSSKHRTSQPAWPAPAPQNTSEVLRAGPAGELSGGAPAGVSLRASQTKARLVVLAILDSLGDHHAAVQLGGKPGADRGPLPLVPVPVRDGARVLGHEPHRLGRRSWRL